MPLNRITFLRPTARDRRRLRAVAQRLRGVASHFGRATTATSSSGLNYRSMLCWNTRLGHHFVSLLTIIALSALYHCCSAQHLPVRTGSAHALKASLSRFISRSSDGFWAASYGACPAARFVHYSSSLGLLFRTIYSTWAQAAQLIISNSCLIRRSRAGAAKGIYPISSATHPHKHWFPAQTIAMNTQSRTFLPAAERWAHHPVRDRWSRLYSLSSQLARCSRLRHERRSLIFQACASPSVSTIDVARWPHQPALLPSFPFPLFSRITKVGSTTKLGLARPGSKVRKLPISFPGALKGAASSYPNSPCCLL